MPSNEEVLAEASIESVAVPMVEMLLLEDILEEPEVAKPSLWAKLFRRAEQEAPAFDIAAEATQPETPDVQPVAAASVVEIFAPSMEPAKRNLWAKLFRRSTVETPGVEPIAINNAWEAASLQPSLDVHSEFVAEVPATEEVCAAPTEAMQWEMVAPASELDARPAKQSLWAKLFHRTTADVAPVPEPAEAMHSEFAAEVPATEEVCAAPTEAMQSEMVAPASELDAGPAKQSLWAKLFHRTAAGVAPVPEPAEAMHSEIAAELPAIQEAPSIEPVAAEPIPVNNAWDAPWTQPAEAMQSEMVAPTSELDAGPAKQSLWAKLFHRTTAGVAPIAELAEAMHSEIAAELPAIQEAPSIEPVAVEPIPVNNAWDTPWTQPAEAMQSEMVAPASELDARPAKQSLWAKLFHRTTAGVAPIAELDAIQEAPGIEPVAAEPIPVNNAWDTPWTQPAEALQSEMVAPASELDARPAKQSLWAELFHSATEDAAPLVAVPAEAIQSEMVAPTSELDAPPAKQSLWAKLFHRTTAGVAPIAELAEAMHSEIAAELPAIQEAPGIEPVAAEPIPVNNAWDTPWTQPAEALQSEMVAPASELDARPAKQSRWAKLFHRTAEQAARVEPIAINSAWYMQEPPSIEPVVPASALEAASSSPDPAQLSLWSKLFRPAEDEAHVEPMSESQLLDTPWADADEVIATEEAWEEPEPAKRSLWAKLFRRATDESPRSGSCSLELRMGYSLDRPH